MHFSTKSIFLSYKLPKIEYERTKNIHFYNIFPYWMLFKSVKMIKFAISNKMSLKTTYFAYPWELSHIQT